MSEAPLILTLRFDGEAFARLDDLRRAHFPPERNQIPAHLTLFHALPGEALEEVGLLAGVGDRHLDGDGGPDLDPPVEAEPRCGGRPPQGGAADVTGHGGEAGMRAGAVGPAADQAGAAGVAGGRRDQGERDVDGEGRRRQHDRSEAREQRLLNDSRHIDGRRPKEQTPAARLDVVHEVRIVCPHEKAEIVAQLSRPVLDHRRRFVGILRRPRGRRASRRGIGRHVH